MKQIKLLSLLFIGFTLFMFSCDPDNSIEEEIEVVITPKVENNLINALTTSNTGGLDLGCITILFPFQLELLNGDIIAVNSTEEFIDALENDAEQPIFDFVYPVLILDEEDTQQTMSNTEELGEAFGSCVPQEGWDDGHFPAYIVGDDECYQISYPIDLIDIDDNTITVANQDEFIDVLTGNNMYFFVFPFDLVDEEGTILTVADEYELFDALYSCVDEGPTSTDSITFNGLVACYNLALPLNLLLDDGTVVTVNNYDEFNTVLLNGHVIDFAYPINLVDEDGILYVANNEVEFLSLIDSCYNSGGGTSAYDFELTLISGEDICYNINFPIDMVDLNGVDFQALDINELYNHIFNQDAFVKKPVTITMKDDGEEIMISLTEEIIAIQQEGC